jgi:uncharacterized protein (TIGR00730 family)
MAAKKGRTMAEQLSPLRAYQNPYFLASDAARIIRILSEYIEPDTRLKQHKVNSTVLFLGSARVVPGDTRSPLFRYYQEAEELAYRISKWAIPLRPKGKNFVVCTGAGPGIMEAANRGAVRAGGKTIGMNITLPLEQGLNPYVSPDLAFSFHYFFMRKLWLVSRARAVIAFPGGYGTLDEFFETMTLVQTGKIDRREVVVILYGSEYWDRVLDFQTMVKMGAIAPGDRDLCKRVSSVPEAMAILKRELARFLKPVPAAAKNKK